MAQLFTYLGGGEMWYQDYKDDATGKMLIAEPEQGPYSMTPVNPALPVPPNDGRWAEAQFSPPSKSLSPPPTPAVQPASASAAPAPQGGE